MCGFMFDLVMVDGRGVYFFLFEVDDVGCGREVVVVLFCVVWEDCVDIGDEGVFWFIVGEVGLLLFDFL